MNMYLRNVFSDFLKKQQQQQQKTQNKTHLILPAIIGVLQNIRRYILYNTVRFVFKTISYNSLKKQNSCDSKENWQG